MKRIIRAHVRRSVLVTLKTGEGFQGVLFDADSEAFVLRNCGLVEAGGSDRVPVPVDGELLIQRRDVAYLQFV